MKKLIKKILYFIRDLRIYFFWKKNFAAFRGVYESFDSAQISIANDVLGYDTKGTVERYLKSFDQNNTKIAETEYPMFFWLSQIIYNSVENSKLKIFDFGGNFGGHFFKFSNTSLRKDFTWIVCEVDAIAEAGKRYFLNSNLEFTNKFEDIDGSDIFFSSGAIQYVNNFSLALSLSIRKKTETCYSRQIANTKCYRYSCNQSKHGNFFRFPICVQ